MLKKSDIIKHFEEELDREFPFYTIQILEYNYNQERQEWLVYLKEALGATSSIFVRVEHKYNENILTTYWYQFDEEHKFEKSKGKWKEVRVI